MKKGLQRGLCVQKCRQGRTSRDNPRKHGNRLLRRQERRCQTFIYTGYFPVKGVRILRTYFDKKDLITAEQALQTSRRCPDVHPLHGKGKPLNPKRRKGLCRQLFITGACIPFVCVGQRFTPSLVPHLNITTGALYPHTDTTRTSRRHWAYISQIGTQKKIITLKK